MTFANPYLCFSLMLFNHNGAQKTTIYMSQTIALYVISIAGQPGGSRGVSAGTARRWAVVRRRKYINR